MERTADPAGSMDNISEKYSELVNLALNTPMSIFITTVSDVVNSGRLESTRLIRTLNDLCVSLILRLEFQVTRPDEIAFDVGMEYPGETTPTMLLSKDINKRPILNAILQNNVLVEVNGDEIVSINGVQNPTVNESGDEKIRLRRSDINFQDNFEQLFIVTAAIKRMQ